jgi:hypothetical protein
VTGSRPITTNEFQMMEGILVVYLTVNDMMMNLNTDRPLDDGKSHDVTLTVSHSEVSLQVF